MPTVLVLAPVLPVGSAVPIGAAESWLPRARQRGNEVASQVSAARSALAGTAVNPYPALAGHC